jgi:hypothetical protein
MNSFVATNVPSGSGVTEASLSEGQTSDLEPRRQLEAYRREIEILRRSERWM